MKQNPLEWKTVCSPYECEMAVSQVSDTQSTVVLTPRYWVPIGVAIAGTILTFLTPWAGVPVILLGCFLGFQAATVQVQFTATAFELYRGEKQLRQFPFADWQDWLILLPPVPILFFFKEVKSIHFMPMLFDARALLTCLEERCPRS
ncbi:glycerol dehydrogenase [Acaryochloris marina MBIC10699]|nr:glycerol dehydrogenase [Acaryochloris marina MBIC10699]